LRVLTRGVVGHWQTPKDKLIREIRQATRFFRSATAEVYRETGRFVDMFAPTSLFHNRGNVVNGPGTMASASGQFIGDELWLGGARFVLAHPAVNWRGAGLEPGYRGPRPKKATRKPFLEGRGPHFGNGLAYGLRIGMRVPPSISPTAVIYYEQND